MRTRAESSSVLIVAGRRHVAGRRSPAVKSAVDRRAAAVEGSRDALRRRHGRPRRSARPAATKARAYVIERFKASGIQPFGESFEQPFTFSAGRAGADHRAQGRQRHRPHRRLANAATATSSITAHYDHIGVRNGEVFNGADDNASGTAALFALAKYFSAHKPAEFADLRRLRRRRSRDCAAPARSSPTPPVDARVARHQPQHGHDRPRSERPAVRRRDAAAAVPEAVHRAHRGKAPGQAGDGPRRSGARRKTGPASRITRRSATRRFRACTSASRISISTTRRPTTSRR